MLKIVEDQREESFACNNFHMAHIMPILDHYRYLQHQTPQ
jgi:hypothetical protein